MFCRIALLAILAPLVFITASCGSKYDDRNKMVVSVRDQKMLLVKDGKPVKAYPVSTSKFGLGSRAGTNRTPLGRLEVAKKVGGGAPSGAVFKSRRRTGEVICPDTPGRDPIVTRILWLRGKESHNRNTMGRCIYIHGTPAERHIGRPASYGCIRMKSRHVIDLYERVGVGADVQIIRGSLDTTSAGRSYYARHGGRPRATATRW
ncbi:L,D-transpeptidase [Akkermansiaceae bacterium]|nr:L,D-transpeptidase [Akkermansiaceae bacterium]MDC0265244.1 L,D-transpeptidase [bacterium]MDB4273372.1 L,D-transpeptidase [Akkermansiaceae bacterium]MDB4283918.1 L,D-transpeptidase [Akkermansiaceae bacterium]MDB4294482.1 L,D-transpeptidase [Akkermansiaceae bacterium]